MLAKWEEDNVLSGPNCLRFLILQTWLYTGLSVSILLDVKPTSDPPKAKFLLVISVTTAGMTSMSDLQAIGSEVQTALNGP